MTARRLDPASLRSEFPALDQDVHGHSLVYLDNAATSQKPQAVLDALAAYYSADNANVHRGIHELSRRATDAYEGARATIAAWIRSPSPEQVVFTRGTTEALNLVAYAWGLDHVGEGDEILLSIQDHHSNLVPWQLLARRVGAQLRYIELDDQGRWILDDLDTLLTERTRIVSVSHVSNALGTVNPIGHLVREVRNRTDALVVVDGAQAVPHLPVDVTEIGCDLYAFSGHKMCGPTGIGCLWGRAEVLEAMEPFQGGGEMISIVEREGSTWATVPHKFEAGTPNIAGAVGLGAAVTWLDAFDRNDILAHERELSAYCIERLTNLGGVRVFGPESVEERSGVVSFTMEGTHPHDIATILDTHGVAVRAGHHCAQLVMQRYGTAATARASFYLYNTSEDVDRLIEALETVREIFG
jgi:cysteine desulfurase/selenocysteine lyase